MPAAHSKAGKPQEKEEGMAVDEEAASPTSAVESSDEDLLKSKYSGKMRGFSQEGEEAKEIENPKKRLSFKGDTPGKEGDQNPNPHQTPDGKKRNKQNDDDADDAMNPTATASGAQAAAQAAAPAAQAAAEPPAGSTPVPASSWVTPEELIGIRDTVNKLDKKVNYHADTIDGHTRILRQQLFEKRKESDIKTSLSYEIGGLPIEADHEAKARFICSLIKKADIPSHELAQMGFKTLARGSEVWGLEFRSNGIKPKFEKAVKNWGETYYDDGKGNNNSIWWQNKIEFIWPETMAQKDIRMICNMIWQAVKEIVGEDMIKSDKGIYIHHQSSSLVSKSFGTPVVKVVLDENSEDPTSFIYIADKYYDTWRNKIDDRIHEEEKAVAKGTFKGKGKGKGKGKDKDKGKEQTININPHEFIKTSRTAYWHKSFRTLSAFATKHPEEWKEIENQKERRKSSGDQKGKGKGKGKRDDSNKSYNNESAWKWESYNKGTASESSTKASEHEWKSWPDQQQWKKKWPDQNW